MQNLNLSPESLVQNFESLSKQKPADKDRQLIIDSLTSIVVPVLRRIDMDLQAVIEDVKSQEPQRIEAAGTNLENVLKTRYQCVVFYEQVPSGAPSEFRITDFGKAELVVNPDLAMSNDPKVQQEYVAELVHQLGVLGIVLYLKDTAHDQEKLTPEIFQKYKNLAKKTNPPLTHFIDALYLKSLKG